MPENTCSVLIAEDQDIARLGLRLTLEKMPGIEVIGEAADGESVIAQTEEFHPKIILMDIGLPGVNGIEATKQIKKRFPNTGIIMFTSDSSDQAVFAALGAGADGYCLKNISADQLRTAIDSVDKGAAWLDPGIAHRVLHAQVQAKEQANDIEALTPRNSLQGSRARENPVLDEQQLEVLRLIGKGLNTEQIAKQLNLSMSSVESCLRSILGGSIPNQVSLKPIQPGTILSERFSIETIIGTGGMCTVYRGKDLTMGRTVAIKMLNQQEMSDIGVKRFLQEAKTASSISHPNVITIFDFGLASDGQPYIVMDYLNGVSLDELIDDHKLTLTRTLSIFIQVCNALAAAHKRGIIHRDLKPSNIMLIKNDNGTDMVKLVDFGMAKFVIESEDLKLSKTGDLCGTPIYMSPEHFRSQKLDSRSDIYSLGCVLYEALTGAPPFTALSLYDLMNAHVHEQASRLPFLSPGKGIPPELETVLFQTLEKEPEQRPQSITELRSILASISSSLT